MLVEIERFVNWVRRRSPEARTWRDYGYDLHFFMQSVGDRPPGEITFHDVDQFVSQQSAKGFKPSTINRRIASIVAFYVFLMPEDEKMVCPVLPRRHHLREPQRLPRPVKETDLQHFFAVIKEPRDLAMFTLMLRCGLRISEVARMRIGDIYMEQDLPRLVIRGKGSRERVVYLSNQAERALRSYLAIRPCVSSEFVFLSYLENGLSTTSIHNRLIVYRKQASIPITAHRLRHSFATDLNSAEVPITTIQKLMGHRWIESTQIYVLADDKQVQADYFAASKKIEGWLR
jgi:site-specific recombinase XerD